MILYRPVGLKELELIYDSGLKKFPPRLPEQPIFYPVLNFQYAKQIANDWNTKEPDAAGYVTRFRVNNDFIQQYERKIVGGKDHEELWIPAEDLDKLNDNIFGHIEIVSGYFGSNYNGVMPQIGVNPKNINAFELLKAFYGTFNYNGMDFRGMVIMNNKSVFCNYPYWKTLKASELGIEDQERFNQMFLGLQDAWECNFPSVKLPGECKIFQHEL